MALRLSEIVGRIHEWIPPVTAQPYDNVGLQVGDLDSEISRGIVALDLTPAVVDEAVAAGAELIVTHHPLLFKSLKRVVASDFVGGLVHRLVSNGIAVVSAHTNLDAASDGVSARLAELLGLTDTGFLEPLESDRFKMVTYVPEDHADSVRSAIAEVVTLTIGPYSDTAFQSRGTSFFTPLEGANPFVGETGAGIQRVDDLRLEMTIAARDVGPAIRALLASHPYESVAYDVLPVALPSDHFGLGMVGDLVEPIGLNSFLQMVCDSLELPAARYVGDEDEQIKRVAVCGGSGRDLVGAALKAGADAFVSADLSYHTFFEVLDASGAARMALVDAGHYETEAATEALLTDWLRAHCSEVDWRRTTVRTSPIAYHVPR